MKIDIKQVKLDRLEQINKDIRIAAKKKDRIKLIGLNFEKRKLLEDLRLYE